MKIPSRLVFPIALCLGILMIGAYFALVGWRFLATMTVLSALLGASLVPMRPRAGLIILCLAAVPSIVYLAWALAERPAWNVGQAVWDVSETGGRSAACTDILPPVTGSSIAEQKDYSQAKISPLRAMAISDAVFFNDGPDGVIVNVMDRTDGPRLVTATFPDNTTRLAWYTVQTSNGEPVEGTSTNLYIDAHSGAVLMLIHDVHVPSDVQFDCGHIQASGAQHSYQSTLVPLGTWQFYLSGYLGLLVLIAGLYLGLRVLRGS